MRYECVDSTKGKSATKVEIVEIKKVNGEEITFSEEQIRGFFGDLAAEDETKERFSSYFIKTDVYNKVHNFLPIRVLVAHKGIGKSAVFRMSYLENINDNVLCVWVKPDDILKLADAEVESDPLNLIRQWKRGLENLLVEKVINNFNIHDDNEMIQPQLVIMNMNFR